MPILPHDVANTIGADSIAAQLQAFGLLPRDGGGAVVIDLSNPAQAAPGRPQRPRLVRPQRTRCPRLIGWPSESGRQLECWCAYCGWHYHGRHGHEDTCRRLLGGQECGCELHVTRSYRAPCTCPPGAGDGHRSAHCPPGSPFRESGYQVREVRP